MWTSDDTWWVIQWLAIFLIGATLVASALVWLSVGGPQHYI